MENSAGDYPANLEHLRTVAARLRSFARKLVEVVKPPENPDSSNSRGGCLENASSKPIQQKPLRPNISQYPKLSCRPQCSASSAICPSNQARSCFHWALSGESFVNRAM